MKACPHPAVGFAHADYTETPGYRFCATHLWDGTQAMFRLLGVAWVTTSRAVDGQPCEITSLVPL